MKKANFLLKSWTDGLLTYILYYIIMSSTVCFALWLIGYPVRWDKVMGAIVLVRMFRATFRFPGNIHIAPLVKKTIAEEAFAAGRIFERQPEPTWGFDDWWKDNKDKMPNE